MSMNLGRNLGRIVRLLPLAQALVLLLAAAPGARPAFAQSPVPPGSNTLTGPVVSNDQLLLQQLQYGA